MHEAIVELEGKHAGEVSMAEIRRSRDHDRLMRARARRAAEAADGDPSPPPPPSPPIAPAAADPLQPREWRKVLRSAKAKSMALKEENPLQKSMAMASQQALLSAKPKSMASSSSTSWLAPDSGCDQNKAELFADMGPHRKAMQSFVDMWPVAVWPIIQSK